MTKQSDSKHFFPDWIGQCEKISWNHTCGECKVLHTVEDKKKVKKNHNLEPNKNIALFPMTVSQPQCSAVHGLDTFSHVNKCETTTEADRGHFAVFVRIRRHSLAWKQTFQEPKKAKSLRKVDSEANHGASPKPGRSAMWVCVCVWKGHQGKDARQSRRQSLRTTTKHQQ